MKRIVICCDGTWDTPDQKINGVSVETNVSIIANALLPVHDGISQMMYYGVGVGTSGNWLQRMYDGATGSGLSKHMLNIYRYLIYNYDEGDELFLFGFSRGAFTARTLAGMIRNSGILKRNAIDQFDAAFNLYRSRKYSTQPREREATLFRRSYAVSDITPIKFIGVWDTVGALGNPLFLNGIVSRRNSFHDYSLSSKVEHAYQAISIDEKRRNFRIALWEKNKEDKNTLEQVWFIGVHCDIGGGYLGTGLSDIALEWMAEKAQDVGLGLDKLKRRPNYMQLCDESRTGLYRLIPSFYRKISSDSKKGKEDKYTYETLHPSVLKRYKEDPTYRPKNLVDYLSLK